MPYQLLTLAIDERGVASVELNRPEVHNAFNDALISELTTVFRELDKNDAVRIALLSGAGKSFCAGGDINWMKATKGYSEQENIADSEKLENMFATIHAFSKPLIGVVHGYVFGGGSGLTAVCDYVVASEASMFGFTETRLGLVPATIAPYVMEKIGNSAALAYFVSGLMFPPDVARDIGLIHASVPEEMLATARAEVVAEFLKAGPQAARKAKALVREVMKLKGNKRELTAYTTKTIAQIRTTDEAQEGMAALLEKRKSAWSLK